MKKFQGLFLLDCVKNERFEKKLAELARTRDSNKGGAKNERNVAKDVDDFIDSLDDYCGHN